MSDLAQFLLARIAEDERKWGNPAFAPVAGVGLSELVLKVRAECEAKRRIVALHRPAEAFSSDPNLRHCESCSTPDYFENPHWVDWPCRTLLLLAQPYAEHPDYREEWRP